MYELVTRYLEIESTIRRAQPEISNVVQVAAIYSVGLRDMNQYIERFAADPAGDKVQIEYLHPDRVYEKVLEGAADLGLVSFPKKSRGLAAIPWREEEMVVTCAPNHALARQRLSVCWLGIQPDRPSFQAKPPAIELRRLEPR